jgi:oligopeptide/dipeptide ABC transporter ATP-binding protein
MNDAVLSIEGLRTHFFTKAGVVKAVDDVSFSLARGEVLGLVGESGSGKSMTGYSIMGLVDAPGRIIAGRIMYREDDLTRLGSEAMRQRVAIAIALLNAPDVIIADEPTTALDVTIQGQILFEMQKLTRETGAALIWITHDLSVVAGLADRVCVMYAGRIVEHGTTSEVLGTPRHPYTRGLLDSVPGQANERKRLRQIPGMTPSLLEIGPGCAFRARCAYATGICEETPEMTPIGAHEHALRCFHPLPAAGA